LKLDSLYASAFAEYVKPLLALERTFRLAGEKIEFRPGILNGEDRYVEILCDGKKNGIKFIEGDSPAQAIKDVASAVRL
jgi:hypothetical protein